jgi:3-oxoacyl-[acyl-carrier protein] reductase
MTLAGKIALVTGASRGIGKAITIELAKHNATVIGIDYSAELAEQITTYLGEMKLKGRGFVMDVTKQEIIEETLSTITETYGAPNILVNNAGITRDNLMLRMSIDEWHQVISTNLDSVFRLCRLCIRDMVKAKWGRIVNISSVAAYVGNAGQTNYCAAKGGMVAFGKALALEIASRGITVNTVAPGFIESDMTKRLTPAQRDSILATIPMKKPGQPEDVAKVVTFLVSDAAAYITGETMHVNGGMFMS